MPISLFLPPLDCVGGQIKGHIILAHEIDSHWDVYCVVIQVVVV